MPQDVISESVQTAALADSATPLRPRYVLPAGRTRGLLLLLIAVALLLWGRVWWSRSKPSTPPAVAVPSLRILQTACTRSSDNPAAFAALGMRLEQLGVHRLAYGCLARAASLAPGDGAICFFWARLAAEEQSPRQAVAILVPFVQAHPADADAHLALAEWYQKLSFRGRAYNEAAISVRLNSAHPAAFRVMATSAIALQRYREAEAALRQVLTLDPTDWQSALDLGFVLDTINRQPEAMECYRQAARTASGAATPLRVYAQAILQETDNAQSAQEADHYLQKAVRLDPQDVLTHVLLAQVAIRRENWPSALAQIDITERLPPAASPVQLLQTFLTARICQRLGQPQRMQRAQKQHAALLAYQTKKSLLFDHIVAHPTDLAARLTLARICASKGDIAEAIAASERLLTYAPNNSAAEELAALQRQHRLAASAQKTTPVLPALPLALILQDASTLAAERQNEAAGQAYGTALALDPDSAPALLGEGLSLRRQGKTDLAFAFLDKAFQHGAQEPAAELAVAAQFEADGFHEAARVRLERLTVHDPGNAASWHLLGRVCSQALRYSRESRESYLRAAELTPKNVVYLLDAADAAAEGGQTALAEATYRRALALAPNDSDSLSRLGGFLVSSGADGPQAAEADTLLGRALAARPDNEFAWYQRGRLALNRGRDQEAVIDLRRSVALAPSVAQPWYALAGALQRTGAVDQARRALAESQRLQQNFFACARLEEQVHLSPGNTALRLRLARVYASVGENARAIVEYQTCLEHDPKQAIAQDEFAAFQRKLHSQGRMPSLLIFHYMQAQQ